MAGDRQFFVVVDKAGNSAFSAMYAQFCRDDDIAVRNKMLTVNSCHQPRRGDIAVNSPRCHPSFGLRPFAAAGLLGQASVPGGADDGPT
ncbi:hypothetical protein [Catellatospora methionotrophica]|uniref:hypothetical protein n=1 Tax=Catellatospora methionotrophica TaxID=121620 RepID=UPI0034065142